MQIGCYYGLRNPTRRRMAMSKNSWLEKPMLKRTIIDGRPYADAKEDIAARAALPPEARERIERHKRTSDESIRHASRSILELD